MHTLAALLLHDTQLHRIAGADSDRVSLSLQRFVGVLPSAVASGLELEIVQVEIVNHDTVIGGFPKLHLVSQVDRINVAAIDGAAADKNPSPSSCGADCPVEYLWPQGTSLMYRRWSIPDAKLAKVFEPIYRLTIACNIAQLHGGTLELHNTITYHIIGPDQKIR